MPQTEDSNCPDGMESNSKVWVIILFILLCLGLSLAHSFNRKSVYRNSTSPIEIKGTCLRCDLMYYGRLMVSLITKVTVNQKLKPCCLKELLWLWSLTCAKPIPIKTLSQFIWFVKKHWFTLVKESSTHILIRKSLFARKSKRFGISNFCCIYAFRGG